MIIVNTDLRSFISGVCSGTNFSIPFTKDKLDKLKELEAQSKNLTSYEEFKDVVAQFKEELKVDYKSTLSDKLDSVSYVPETGQYHLTLGKGYSAVYIPEKIMNLIIDNDSRGIENTPIINMCRRFLANPKPTQDRFNMLANYVTQTWLDYNAMEELMDSQGLSEEVATKFCTYSDIQITQEGYLKTSKVVDVIKGIESSETKQKLQRDSRGRFIKPTQEQRAYLESMEFEPAIYKSGDKFYSGGVLGYKYEIGKLASLPSWDFTSLVDNTFHHKGLHNGGLRYVEGYLHGDRQLLDVFVCPSQIAKFTDEGIGEMTCKEFFIFGTSTIDGNMKSLYHTSTYAKIQSEQIQKDMDELVKAKEEIASKLDEIDSKIHSTADFHKLLSI